MQFREEELISENYSQFGLESEIRLHEVEIASNRASERRGEYVLGIYRDWETDRKSTRLNSSHRSLSRMPSSA